MWIEKRVTVIVAFHFMKCRLKNVNPKRKLSPEVQQLSWDIPKMFARKGRVKNYEIIPFFEKKNQSRKKGDPLLSLGTVCYAEN